MAQTGRHVFTIDKADTPTRTGRADQFKGDMQSKLRAFGNFSRHSKFGREWPALEAKR